MAQDFTTLAKAVGAEDLETKNPFVSEGVKWLPGLGSNQADLEQRFYQIAQWRSLGYHWQLLSETEKDFVNLLVFEVTKALVDRAQQERLPLMASGPSVTVGDYEGYGADEQLQGGHHRTGPTVPQAERPEGNFQKLRECPADADEAKPQAF